MGPICRADYTIASVQNIERNNAHKYRAFGRDRKQRALYRAVHFIEVQIIESRLYFKVFLKYEFILFLHHLAQNSLKKELPKQITKLGSQMPFK